MGHFACFRPFIIGFDYGLHNVMYCNVMSTNTAQKTKTKKSLPHSTHPQYVRTALIVTMNKTDLHGVK